MHLSVIKGKYAADVLSASRCAHLCVMSGARVLARVCEKERKKERKKKERGHFGGLCI